MLLGKMHGVEGAVLRMEDAARIVERYNDCLPKDTTLEAYKDSGTKHQIEVIGSIKKFANPDTGQETARYFHVLACAITPCPIQGKSEVIAAREVERKIVYIANYVSLPGLHPDARKIINQAKNAEYSALVAFSYADYVCVLIAQLVAESSMSAKEKRLFIVRILMKLRPLYHY